MTTNNTRLKCIPQNEIIFINSMIDDRLRRSKDLFIDDDRQEDIVHCRNNIFGKHFKCMSISK